MRDLANKRIAISGAGHGLGRDMARAFAKAGAEIIVTDRNLAGAEETARLIEADGCRAAAYALDVTDLDAIRQFRERLHAERGPIDVLINNAGVAYGGAFLDVPVENHLATYRVNALGMVAMTHAFLPDLIARPEGHLVIIASGSALIALPYASTYASSKWAALGFSESIREELRILGHRHVRVTAICPSYIDTGMCDGVKLPRFTRMLRSPQVAEMALRAVRRNRDLVLTPWLVYITPFTKAMLPPPLFRKVADFFGITGGMATWYGHDKPAGK
ncbi:MAG TPA: SDR family NAD(P)-dependent oxidoreductase [Pirellulales bacterium]|nr:SDR family NAD(P)-dependent oxidoreductase [Pirellulales bacterium]